jgi:hypothetical protein
MTAPTYLERRRPFCQVSLFEWHLQQYKPRRPSQRTAQKGEDGPVGGERDRFRCPSLGRKGKTGKAIYVEGVFVGWWREKGVV